MYFIFYTSQTQYIKFSHIYSKFVHRFKQPTLRYTMISCDNTVNRKGADSKTWKFIEKYIKLKRYDDKVTFYKL